MDEVIVTGRDEGFDFYEQLRLEQLLQQQEEERRRAFAPPVPEVLPEVPVTGEPGAPPPGFVTQLMEVLGRWLWVLVPQPTGPREHDELDEFDVMWTPPPPNKPPPASTDPIMPPNWNDMLEWPGTPTYVPITPVNLGPVEMPAGEPEFVVSPPRPTLRPELPTYIEDPYGIPDLGIDFRPGPAPAPIGAPRSDPVFDPFSPDLEPSRVPQPDRPGTIAPDLFGAPLPDVVGNPFGDPFSPSPLPTPPSTKPRTPTVPDFLMPEPPGLTPDVVPEPILTGFKGDPITSKDQCQCGKKKKKKKRKDREVCYRGTYVETKRGLVKKRLEQVPCDAPQRSTGSKGAPTKSKKLKPGQFPGLGFMGSENLTPSDWLDLAGSAVKEFAPIVRDILARSKPKKQKKPTKGRKPKTKPGRLPGTVYTSPFPIEFGG